MNLKRKTRSTHSGVPALAMACIAGLVAAWPLPAFSQSADDRNAARELRRAEADKAREARRDAQREALEAKREVREAELDARRAESKARADDRRERMDRHLEESKDRLNQRREEQRSQRAAAQHEREQKTQAFCDRIRTWLTAIPVPDHIYARRSLGGLVGPSTGSSGVGPSTVSLESWLLQDQYFVPVFGQPFEKLSGEERQALSRGNQDCPVIVDARGRQIGDKMLFSRVYQAGNHPRYVAGVVQIRNAHAEADKIIPALVSLGPDASGLQRFRTLAEDRAKIGSLLAGERFQAWEQAYRQAFQRVAAPMHFDAMRQARKGREPVETLVAMNTARKAYQDDARLADATADLPPDLAKLHESLVSSVIADERKRIDGLGEGLPALEKGIEWRHDYQRRLSGVDGRMASLLQHFQAHRAGVLAAAQPAIAALIASAGSPAELNLVKSRYLPYASDLSGPVGGDLASRIEAKRTDLHKQSVLAASGYQDRPRPEQPRSASDVPANDRATSSATGEPTQGEMYDVFQARAGAINAEIDDLVNRCNRREFKAGSGDPLMAMQCLQLTFAGGLADGGRNIAGPRVSIARFEKVGCAPAGNAPGYRCDYRIGTDVQGQLPDSVRRLFRSGEMNTARFVRTSQGWVVVNE